MKIERVAEFKVELTLKEAENIANYIFDNLPELEDFSTQENVANNFYRILADELEA